MVCICTMIMWYWICAYWHTYVPNVSQALYFVYFIGLPIPIVVVSTAISNEYYGINDRYLNNKTL